MTISITISADTGAQYQEQLAAVAAASTQAPNTHQLEADLKWAEEENSRLSLEFSHLQNDNQNLANELREKEAEIEEAEGLVEQLRKDNMALIKERDELKRQVEEATAAADINFGEAERLRAELNQLKEAKPQGPQESSSETAEPDAAVGWPATDMPEGVTRREWMAWKSAQEAKGVTEHLDPLEYKRLRDAGLIDWKALKGEDAESEDPAEDTSAEEPAPNAPVPEAHTAIEYPEIGTQGLKIGESINFKGAGGKNLVLKRTQHRQPHAGSSSNDVERYMVSTPRDRVIGQLALGIDSKWTAEVSFYPSPALETVDDALSWIYARDKYTGGTSPSDQAKKEKDAQGADAQREFETAEKAFQQSQAEGGMTEETPGRIGAQNPTQPAYPYANKRVRLDFTIDGKRYQGEAQLGKATQVGRKMGYQVLSSDIEGLKVIEAGDVAEVLEEPNVIETRQSLPDTAAVTTDGKWAKDLDPAKGEKRPAPGEPVFVVNGGPQPNPSAPPEVQEATKAIAEFEQLPEATLTPEEIVTVLTEEGEVLPGMLIRRFAGTERYEVKLDRGGYAVALADRIRGRARATEESERELATIPSW